MTDQEAEDQPSEQHGATSAPEPRDPATPSDLSLDGDGRTVEAIGSFYANRAQNVVFNQFNGPSEVGTAGIGSAGALLRTVRRDDGSVSADEVNRALRRYVRPKTFDRALAIVRESNMVILIGGNATGRALASLALAAELTPGADITRMPPTRTLAEIAKKSVQTGRVYVIHDWAMVAEESPVTLDYDARQLIAKLREASAYLVLTADDSLSHLSRLAGLDELLIRWAAPDPVALLDHCLSLESELGLCDAELDLLRDRARTVARPSRVVELADHAITAGTQAALAAVNDDDVDCVRDWLKRADRGNVRLATALVFVGGLPQRRFELLHASLSEVQSSFESVLGDPEARPPDDTSPFPQHRRALTDEDGIGQFLIQPPGALGAIGNHRPAFRTPELQKTFLAGLVDGYDHTLWRPVRVWLDQVTEGPFDNEHAAIANAVALLAEFSLDDVYAYVDAWAAGPLSKRLTASCVLWRMAGTDASASTALRWAVSWTRDRGQERAMTAAIAFSGVLGQRYPLEATRWLWHLIRRSMRVRAVAQIALGNLLDELTGSADGPEPLLRFLATKLRRLVESEADATQRRIAFAAAAQLLGYEVSAKGPVAARVLREHPDQCDRLGRLWALTISSRPHRRTALDALCKTLEALDSRDEGKDIAFRLGAVILPRLGGGALAAVKMTLLNVSREPPLSSAILSSFLDVLKQAATPERDPGTRQFVKTRRETDDYDISDH